MIAQTDGDPKGPTAEQREAMTLVSRLPDGFPFDKWDDMTTKAQLIRMQHTRLSDQEQWTLLNSPTPLRLLDQMNREREQDSVYGGNTPEMTPSEEKLYMRKWRREKAAQWLEEEESKERDSDHPVIYDYPAVGHFLGDEQPDARQTEILWQAQQNLDRLYARGNATQQQIDNVIALT